MNASQLIILMSFLEAGIRLYEKTTAGMTPEQIDAMAAEQETRTKTVREAFDKEFGAAPEPE